MNSQALIKFSLSVLIALSAGCAEDKKNTDGITVITTLFPQYDFAKQITKGKADVRILLPPGVEAHAYEPTPRDIMKISRADIFIYTGETMEPWAHKIIESINKKSRVLTIESGKNIALISHEEEDDDETDKNGKDHGTNGHHDHAGADPHIWTDPANAKLMVDNILEALLTIDPGNSEFYRKNAENYKKELDMLDRDFSEMFKKTKFKTIIYGGHFAFGYFAKRYGLKYVSPYHGFSPDAEPRPGNIAGLIALMRETGMNTIYFEELIDPKVAKVISGQTGADMLLLHGAHNVTHNELDEGITYISIMRNNLVNLKKGLGYSE